MPYCRVEGKAGEGFCLTCSNEVAYLERSAQLLV